MSEIPTRALLGRLLRPLLACLGLLSMAIGFGMAPAHAVEADLPVNSPVSGTITKLNVYLEFAVSHTPDPDSLKYTFDGTGTDFVMVLQPHGIGTYQIYESIDAPGAMSFATVTPRNTPIPDGFYTITVSYDSGGTHYSHSVPNVKIDRETQTPSLSSPASNSKSPMNMHFVLSVPEGIKPGSYPQLVLNWGPAWHIINLKPFDAGVTRDFTLNLADSGAAMQANNPSVVASAYTGILPRIGDKMSVEFSYQDTIGNTEASVINTNVTLATPCGLGTWSSDGFGPCTMATPGHYVAGSQATSQTDCPAGTFQQNAGSTECVTAPLDTYVASTGATAALACPTGSHTASTGSTSAADCRAAVVDQPTETVPSNEAATPVPVTVAPAPVNLTPAPVAASPLVACAFGVGSKLELKCVLSLSGLSSLQPSAVSISALKKSSKVCVVQKGKLVAKRVGTCRVLIAPKAANSRGEKHRVALTVS